MLKFWLTFFQRSKEIRLRRRRWPSQGRNALVKQNTEKRDIFVFVGAGINKQTKKNPDYYSNVCEATNIVIPADWFVIEIFCVRAYPAANDNYLFLWKKKIKIIFQFRNRKNVNFSNFPSTERSLRSPRSEKK
jgi:hypothetical protein